jgi:hypothetical protein
MEHKKLVLIFAVLSLLCLFTEAQKTFTGTRSLIHGDFNVTWSLDEATKEITFTCVVRAENKWIGIGIGTEKNVLMTRAAYMVSHASLKA